MCVWSLTNVFILSMERMTDREREGLRKSLCNTKGLQSVPKWRFRTAFSTPLSHFMLLRLSLLTFCGIYMLDTLQEARFSLKYFLLSCL